MLLLLREPRRQIDAQQKHILFFQAETRSSGQQHARPSLASNIDLFYRAAPEAMAGRPVSLFFPLPSACSAEPPMRSVLRGSLTHYRRAPRYTITVNKEQPGIPRETT